MYTKTGYEAVEKAKLYKNNMELDLFVYKGRIYEGKTGLQVCGAADELETVINNKGGTDWINKRIEGIISQNGESPRYTRPGERKKDIFPREKNENIVFAKDTYGKKHYYYRFYNENGIELFTLSRLKKWGQEVFVSCAGYMLEVNQKQLGFDEFLKWLAGLENGVKGEVERVFNESIADPAELADIGFANVLGRYDEAAEHNKPIIEARELEIKRKNFSCEKS
jgi:hypothetical protein